MPTLVRLLVCLCCLLPGPCLAAGETMHFIHPPPENPQDQRLSYYWEMLDSALQASSARYGPYTLRSYGTPLSPQRALAEVASGDAGRINIVARAGNRELEDRLRPVPIPLDKGLLGYRLLLIRPELQARLTRVATLDELKSFRFGQGAGWVDSKILRSAGLTVLEGSRYENLFPMLRAGRFDVLPRGANEIRAEWQVQQAFSPQLRIENHLLLYYPMPRYFFVPRTALGAQMAERIEFGLRELAADGRFQRQYLAYKQQVLAGLNLRGRTVLRLANPFLAGHPAESEPFWWDDLHEELALPANIRPRR